MAKNNKTCFFYVLYSDKTRVFDQSERAYYPIYIIIQITSVNPQGSVNQKNSHVMYENSYTMENSFREARLGDVSLDSDINMHKAHYDK